MGSQYGDENDNDDDEQEEGDGSEYDRSGMESTTDGPYDETLFGKGQGDETPPETPSPQRVDTGGVSTSMISSFSPFKAFQRRGLGGGRAVYPVDLDQLYSEEEAACLRGQQDHDPGHNFSPRARSPSPSESGAGLGEDTDPSGLTSGGGPVGEDFTYDDLDGCHLNLNHRSHQDDDWDADETNVKRDVGGARMKNTVLDFEYERAKALRHEYDEYPSPPCSGANTASQASVDADDVCVSKFSNGKDDDNCPPLYNAPTGTSHTLSSALTHPLTPFLFSECSFQQCCSIAISGSCCYRLPSFWSHVRQVSPYSHPSVILLHAPFPNLSHLYLFLFKGMPVCWMMGTGSRPRPLISCHHLQRPMILTTAALPVPLRSNLPLAPVEGGSAPLWVRY